MFDFLIVGAGFAGSVLAERLANVLDKKVLVIDRRPHIGGNAYDSYDDSGILIHNYGPHIFHTNSKSVFHYLSKFTAWRPYEHRAMTTVDGELFPFPINLDTVNNYYSLNLTSQELVEFYASMAETRDPVRTAEDVVVSAVGRELYEKFVQNYTRKHWGVDPKELDATVTARVRPRVSADDRYFLDRFQAMPLHGFSRMFERMLDHPNIDVMLGTDLSEMRGSTAYRAMIYTGPIDEFFNYAHGKLPYRSLEFRFETRDVEWLQPVAVVHYPNDHCYTRVTEFKHLTGQVHPKTTVAFEYPRAVGEPYYPVPQPGSKELYRRYWKLAAATGGVHFVGRLATYKYYNMDQVTAQALRLFERIKNGHGS